MVSLSTNYNAKECESHDILVNFLLNPSKFSICFVSLKVLITAEDSVKGNEMVRIDA